MANRPYPMIVGQNDAQKCSTILKTLRVQDLQEILKSFGQPRSGKKQDLLDRCERMMSQVEASSLLEKIEEVQARWGGRRCRGAWREAGPADHTPTTVTTTTTHSPRTRSASVRSPASVEAPPPGIGPFKESPFYKHVAALQGVVPLVCNHSGTQSDMMVKFSLRRDQWEGIQEGSSFAHIRFCPHSLHREKLLTDDYPRQLHLRINGVSFTIPDYHPSLSTKQGYKYHSQPIDITSELKLSGPHQPQTLTVYWNAQLLRKATHFLLVHLVEKVASSDLLEKMKEREVIPSQKARDFVRKMMSVADGDIATTSFRVSLTCPLSKVRMVTPMRGAHCNHMQCFDGQVYLLMNERRATWTCVVCNESATYDTLVVDGLVLEILQTTDYSEVEFLSSGEWAPVVPEAKRKGGSEEDSSETESRREESMSPKPLSDHLCIIDLTASDDEEEEGAGHVDPPPACHQPESRSHGLVEDLGGFLDEFLTENQSMADHPYSPRSIATHADHRSPASTLTPHPNHSSSSVTPASPDSCNFTTQSSIQSSSLVTAQDDPGPVLTPSSMTSGIDVCSSADSTPTGGGGGYSQSNWTTNAVGPGGGSGSYSFSPYVTSSAPLPPPPPGSAVYLGAGEMPLSHDFGSLFAHSPFSNALDLLSTNRGSPISAFNSVSNRRSPGPKLLSNRQSPGLNVGPIPTNYDSFSDGQESIPECIDSIPDGYQHPYGNGYNAFVKEQHVMDRYSPIPDIGQGSIPNFQNSIQSRYEPMQGLIPGSQDLGLPYPSSLPHPLQPANNMADGGRIYYKNPPHLMLFPPPLGSFHPGPNNVMFTQRR